MSLKISNFHAKISLLQISYNQNVKIQLQKSTMYMYLYVVSKVVKCTNYYIRARLKTAPNHLNYPNKMYCHMKPVNPFLSTLLFVQAAHFSEQIKREKMKQ